MGQRSNFRWLEFILGILLVILGIYTFADPSTALTSMMILYGMMSLITGIVDIVIYIKLERHTGFGPVVALISGVFSIMAGILILLFPGTGKWVLALYFPIWFIAHCISRLATLNFAWMISGTAYYNFSLVLNILGLLLGFILLFNPRAALMSISFIIGLYLILLGVGSIVLAFSNVGRR